ELLPLALIITPNIPEAEELAKIKVSSIDDMKKSAEIICGLGAKNVVVKGGHLAGNPVDILYDGKNFHEFISERIDTKNTHGTGCTFSAAIATKLAKGKSVFEAVKTAKKYTTTAIRFSLNIGGGHGPTNHLAYVRQESERYNCIQKLKAALQRLNAEKCGNIIPEVQSNLGYALPCASKAEDIAAIPGRIIRIGEKTKTFGDLSFGASSHIASIILSAMKYNANYRCAMNIRFSENIINICMSLGFDVDNFDRSNEPDDTKFKEGYSLKWGIDSVLLKRNSIPDIIFDRGDLGKEPMIRVIGKNPADVVDKVLSISKRLKVL
ncbi:MAG: PfkB family carbohydrate kinase, partial [Deltaproteobacteria bacterium]|nr:PfkB family carbohydrate kinase [Deltaproteobacteria bacterium]